jgi:platelet-activating factor acetylhydrolase
MELLLGAPHWIAVEVLRHTGRFQSIGKGISYDIWGAAIQSPEEWNRIQRSFLCIDSEAFIYWTSNFKAVLALCEEAKAMGRSPG